jgi:hypothetical protein
VTPEEIKEAEEVEAYQKAVEKPITLVEALSKLFQQLQDDKNTAEAHCLCMELALSRTLPDYN